MPVYTYNGDEGREYPYLTGDARTPEPGQKYTLPKAPDDRWTSETAKKAVRTRKKAAAAAEVTPEPSEPPVEAPTDSPAAPDVTDNAEESA